MVATPAGMGIDPPSKAMIAGKGLVPEPVAVTVGLGGLVPSSYRWICSRISARLQAQSSLVLTRLPPDIRKGSGSFGFFGYAAPCAFVHVAGVEETSCAEMMLARQADTTIKTFIIAIELLFMSDFQFEKSRSPYGGRQILTWTTLSFEE